MAQFETLVVYDYHEPINLIYGKHNRLAESLKKLDIWETILEEFNEDENEIDVISITDIDELIQHQELNPANYSIKLKLFTNQFYKP